jgi:hypothetical protein
MNHESHEDSKKLEEVPPTENTGQETTPIVWKAHLSLHFSVISSASSASPR